MDMQKHVIDKDVIFSSATELAAAIRAKTLSAVEALDAHLAQIEQYNPTLNAVVILEADAARAKAREADAALARGEVWGALHGVPHTLKDAYATAGMRTTVGSPQLDHVPDRDSTIAARLKNAGAILMGKTNVATMLGDPLQTANPIFGRTNNPWNAGDTPGGSSGGAAAAIASGMTPFEVGTDLGGSIRIPAHFCGVFGFKPTEKRVSLDGVVPGIPAPRSIRIMSCVGPMARSIDDLTLIYKLIAGPDGLDTEVEPVPVDDPPEVSLKGLRVAYAPTFPGLPVAQEIQDALAEVAKRLAAAGAIVEEAPLPHMDYGQVLSGAGELIGMMLGAFQPEADKPPATLAQYLAALHGRDQAIVAWEQFFGTWDVLLCPPSMTSAFSHRATGRPISVNGEDVIYWMGNGHTTLFNYTGHPALVLPYKQDQMGMPIGVQLVGKRWDDSRLLGIGKAVTAITGTFQRPPGY